MMKPILQRFRVQDSRGAEWLVTFSGPTMSGSVQPGEDITKLPAVYLARYGREGHGGEIIVDLEAPDVSEAELAEILERQPEWEYEDWTKP